MEIMIMYDVRRDGKLAGIFHTLEEAQELKTRILRIFPMSNIQIREIEYEEV